MTDVRDVLFLCLRVSVALHIMQSWVHIMNQTRARGQKEPNILDLVLTDDQIIDDIQYLSPLGKSDHAVLF